jgi:hypothetical protein
MEQFNDNRRYSLEKSLLEADKLKGFIATGEAESYEDAHQYLGALERTEQLLGKPEDMLSSFILKPKDTTEFDSLDKWQAKDGYMWVLENGRFVPADENWQPLDLTPQTPTEAPWPGDFCYLSQHPDCKMPGCKTVEKQLAYVHLVDEEGGFANVMLVSKIIDMAGPNDVILNPNETRIPFDVVVEQVCGPVYFNQLSKPVGYTGQEILDRINNDKYFGDKADFPPEKKGESISGPEDPRWGYTLERLKVMKKLFCFCLNRILFEDDLAAEAMASEGQSDDVFDEDDTEFIEGFSEEDEVYDDGSNETDEPDKYNIIDVGYFDDNGSDDQIYKIRHENNQWTE